MKRNVGLVALALLLNFTPQAFAAETTGEWWEVTQKMEMPGMPDFGAMMPGSAPTKICIAPGHDNQPFTSKEKDKDCTISDVKQSGKATTFTMKCTGAHPMTGTGEITSTPTSFSQKMNMHSQEGDMLMVTTGKRIGGACQVEAELDKLSNSPEQKKLKADMDKGIAASNKAIGAANANMEKICGEGATSQDPKILEMGGNYFDHGTGPNRVTAQCQNRQTVYCGQVRKIVGTPAGYRKQDDIRKGFAESVDVATAMYGVETVKECKIDTAPLLKDACKIASSAAVDWGFLVDFCPTDAAAYYQQYCAGYQNDQKQGWEERYSWCRDNENWQSKGQPSPPDQTQPKDTTATGGGANETKGKVMKEGVDALKNMFKF